MAPQFVIYNHKLLLASLVPSAWLGPPGFCPHGVYDTLLWENGRLSDFEIHLDRFQKSCIALDIDAVDCISSLSQDIFRRLALANGLADERCRVRLMAIADGAGELSKTGPFIAAMWTVPNVAPVLDFQCGISSFTRTAGDTGYIHKRLGLDRDLLDFQTGLEEGCNDILFLNNRGEFCEALYANLWVVVGDRLLTPPVDSPCLPGITRQKIIMTAGELLGINTAEAPITRAEIEQAEEIFLSSTIRGIQPVTAVSGLWQGRSGAVATLLAQLQ